MAQQQPTMQLDQATLLAIAQIIRKGSVRKQYEVVSMPAYKRVEKQPTFEDVRQADNTVKKQFIGFKEVEVTIKDAFKVTFPQGHVIVVEADQLERLHLDKDGGLVDMETGEAISMGDNVLSLASAKSAA